MLHRDGAESGRCDVMRRRTASTCRRGGLRRERDAPIRRSGDELRSVRCSAHWRIGLPHGRGRPRWRVGFSRPGRAGPGGRWLRQRDAGVECVGRSDPLEKSSERESTMPADRSSGSAVFAVASSCVDQQHGDIRG